MSIRYNPGEYNEASGTRDAFGAFSDDLVAAGLPPIVVVSGDRSPEVQVAIFVDRFRQQSSGGGPFGDVRWWDGSAWGYGGGTRWVRYSSAGTVAVPGTGNHEKKRSSDLGWPYNAVTTAHLRAREIAARHNITCDGLSFGEAWHWTYWGALGVIGAPSSNGNARPIPKEWDEMASREDIQAALVEVLTSDVRVTNKIAEAVKNELDKRKFFADLSLIPIAELNSAMVLHAASTQRRIRVQNTDHLEFIRRAAQNRGGDVMSSSEVDIFDAYCLAVYPPEALKVDVEALSLALSRIGTGQPGVKAAVAAAVDAHTTAAPSPAPAS